MPSLLEGCTVNSDPLSLCKEAGSAWGGPQRLLTVPLEEEHVPLLPLVHIWSCYLN